jgi:hypothetical protein
MIQTSDFSAHERQTVCSRSCGHSSEADQNGGEPYDAEVVFGFLFVACGNATEPFNPSEESLDDISITIANPVITLFDVASWVGRNAGLAASLTHLLTNPVAVIGCVGDHMSWAKTRQQGRSLKCIASMTRCERDAQRTATTIDGGVHFRCQSAARAAEASSLVGLFFFSPDRRREPQADW